MNGPPFVPAATPDKINETLVPVWTILSGAQIPPEFGSNKSYIDNRDVARIIVWAIDNSGQADGERYLLTAGAPNNQSIADVLNKHYPHLNIQKGNPGEGYLPGFAYPPDGQGIRYDSSKAVKATGQEYIGFEQSTLDAAKVFERYL